MALQVWLPLNGNLANQGVGTMNITASATSSYTDGKLGKSLITGSNYLKIPCGYDSEKLSIALWFKPVTPTAWSDIFSLGDSNNRFEINTATTYYWYSSNSYSLINSGTTMGTFNDKTWYHLAITFDGSKAKIYVNGNLSKESAQSTSLSNAFGSNKNIFIASRNSGDCKYSANMSDIRIYDNALSDREVKELSKGLVCHYTLNDVNVTSSINKYSGDTVLGKANSTDFTMSKNTDGEGYKYTLSYTGTGSNKWYSISYPIVSFEVGKTYDYSCKVRCNSSNFTIYFRSARCGNDWTSNTVSVNKADGKWHEYHLKQKMTGTTFERSSSSDVQTTRPLIEFYTQSLVTNGTVYKCDIDIKDVQISECSDDVPISNASWNDGVLYDSSGYGNHLSISGKTKYEADSQRFDGCINFNQTGYFKKDNLNINFDSFTIAFWTKIPNSITAQHFLFGSFNSWTGNGVGAWRDTSGQTGYSCIMKSNGEDSYGSFRSTIIPAFNQWTHVAYVYNGTQIKTYRNGTLVSNTTYGKSGKCYMPNLYLGNSKYNNTPSSETDQASMSDFRLYATALSDADIKELYDTPISLTNTGTLMTQGEYKEI